MKSGHKLGCFQVNYSELHSIVNEKNRNAFYDHYLSTQRQYKRTAFIREQH